MSQNKSPLLFYSFVYGKQYYIIHHYTYENTSMFYLQILTTKPPSQFSFLRQTTEKTSFHVGYLELFVKKIILFYFQKSPEKLPSTLKKSLASGHIRSYGILHVSLREHQQDQCKNVPISLDDLKQPEDKFDDQGRLIQSMFAGWPGIE